MIINAVKIHDNGKIEVKPIEFSELISALEPGDPDSYDKIFDNN